MKNKIINGLYRMLALAIICGQILMISSCTKNKATAPDQFEDFANITTAGFLINSVNTQSVVPLNVVKKSSGTTIDRDALDFSFKITKTLAVDVTAKLQVNAGMLAAYNAGHNTAYQLLPENAYAFAENTTVSIPKGATESNRVSIKITNLASLVLGQTYLLPVGLAAISEANLPVHDSFKTTYLLVSVSDQAFPSADKPNGIKSVVYVEAASNNILNAGRYTLSTSGKPFFDAVLLFAPNIYWINKKPVVTLGSAYGQLNNPEKYIRPLQRKGIKVLVSFLGAMQNFNTQEIEQISLQIKEIVVRYGLDGINFDDEFQPYDGITMPVANNSSYTLLIKRCKELMPDKIVSLYNIGTIPKVVNGIVPGDYLDYAWQAYYGSYGAPNIPGITDKKKLGPAATWILGTVPQQQPTSVTTAETLAKRTITEGYGVMVFYDLSAFTVPSWMQRVGKALYNEDVVETEGPYQQDW
ncbi:BT_3987 domain-containing protein [Pedobacter gandavensis]|uniref:BT_3987 domain-containing protein n=1 Tax=Pedobacter gandavensis TaxID=2679963 RepID=UPI00292EFA8C|nr:DUF1735 domain-containing protein [Pedobacter gandavensis]